MFEDNTPVGGFIEVTHGDQVVETYALEDGKLVRLILEEGIRSKVEAFEVEATKYFQDIPAIPEASEIEIEDTPPTPIVVECINVPIEPEPIVYKWDFISLRCINDFIIIRAFGEELEYDYEYIRIHDVTLTKTGNTYTLEGQEEQWVAGEYYEGSIDDIEPEYVVTKKRWFGREPKKIGAYRARLKARLPIKRTYHNVAVSILEKT
jgi:hypothetical protein